MREPADIDTKWQKKQRDYGPLKMAYDLENKKWTNANKKCMAVIKNTKSWSHIGTLEETI